MTSLFHGMSGVIRKETLHILRDPSTLVFALVMPLLQLLLFGYAINFDVRHVPLVVVDQNNSRESRDYIQQAQNTQYVDIVRTQSTPTDGLADVKAGKAKAVLIIPPDFSGKLGTSQTAYVRLLLDGSDSLVSSAARSAFARPSTPESGSVEPRISVLFNPDSRTQVYAIPGLIGVILQLVTVTLTAFSLVRERESGTLDQLLVSPVSVLGLLLGKLVPFAILGAIEFYGILILARIIFDIPMAGDLALLTGVSFLYVIAGLSVGLLISTVSKNQAQALQFSLLTTLPSILLSGYISPREGLPGVLTIVSNFLPVTHFIEVARGIMVRGSDFLDVASSVGALGLITCSLLGAASFGFTRSMR